MGCGVCMRGGGATTLCQGVLRTRTSDLMCFKANVEHVHNTNKLDKPYKLKLNKFADMTNQEFRTLYVGSKVNHHRIFRGERLGNSTFMYENASHPAVSIDGHEDVPANNENALLKAASNQPIDVAIDAGGSDFQFYSRGSIQRRLWNRPRSRSCCCRLLSDQRWNKILDNEELMGRKWLHKDEARHICQRRNLWHCDGGLISYQELLK
ncbi:hypothetical protein POM88_038784 [Heracleum sosnowskyi]|uniref:Uncharacterized protein n=1 Tax=Heracleum sosnowskyi TaxID=360622 RepID=A0AAD8HBJ4_9APIA|nr:hypothetical protein POM88_038784 [Heracleum sosnowskyi]